MQIVASEVTLIDHMGTDLSVANAARVSFSKESWWEEDGCLRMADAKLITYLARNKHYSPFNHTYLTFRIKAPIYMARQLVKHEYMPWNEESRRYVSTEPSFAPIKFRLAAENVKQGSGDDMEEEAEWECQEIFWEAIDHALEAYTRLLEKGASAEQARAVLPVNTNTEWYWSGTLKAFHKMLDLRLDAHAQKEAQAIAQSIRNQIMPLFPTSLMALLS